MVWPARILHDTNTCITGKIFELKKYNLVKMNKKTLVIGASENPERYSHLAVQKLIEHEQPVIALGIKKGTINNVPIETEKKQWEDIDTVTLYLSPEKQ